VIATVHSRDLARRLDLSPWQLATVVLAAASLFVAVRWQVAAHGDLSRFVVAGQVYVPGPAAPGLHVFPGPGYDGQFYYRFAVDPFRLDGVVNGVRLDTGLRRQRVGYSLLVWLLSGGRSVLVPYVMVLVNLLGLAALALLGAAFARSYRRSTLWGLAFCVFTGFVSTLSRDLTEITTAALLLGTLLALRLGRSWLATLALTAGVLTRETIVIVAGAIAVARIVDMVRRRAAPSAADAVWLVPLLVFAGWQGLMALRYGTAPLLQEGKNTAPPGSALPTAVAGWITHPDILTTMTLVGVVAATGLVLLVLSAAGRVPLHLTIALAGMGALALTLSAQIWNGDPFELRTLGELHVLGVAALIAAGPRRLLPYLAVAVPLTLVTVRLWLVRI
jgi:hypothetical protein